MVVVVVVAAVAAVVVVVDGSTPCCCPAAAGRWHRLATEAADLKATGPRATAEAGQHRLGLGKAVAFPAADREAAVVVEVVAVAVARSRRPDTLMTVEISVRPNPMEPGRIKRSLAQVSQ